MAGDDALGGVEAEAEAAADGFGGEEGLEDTGLEGGVDAGTVVPDFDVGHVSGAVRREAQDAGSGDEGHGVEGVLDQCGPDLGELAAVGADGREFGVEVALDGDVVEARAEHGESGFERLGDVDVLDGGLIHVGVGLDGGDEVEDADGSVDDGLGHALGAKRAGEGGDGEGEDLGIGGGGELFELIDGDEVFGERGGGVPGLGDVVGVEPAGERLFAVGLGEQAVVNVAVDGDVGHASANALDPILVEGGLLFGEAEGAELVLLVSVLAELSVEGGGGALGGGCGVVELMGEVSGELAEGGELLGLLLHAGDFADAVEEDVDAALAHGRDGCEHVVEKRFVDVEDPDGSYGVSVASVALHA